MWVEGALRQRSSQAFWLAIAAAAFLAARRPPWRGRQPGALRGEAAFPLPPLRGYTLSTLCGDATLRVPVLSGSTLPALSGGATLCCICTCILLRRTARHSFASSLLRTRRPPRCRSSAPRKARTPRPPPGSSSGSLHPIDVQDEDAALNAAVDAVIARDRSALDARKRAHLESASSSDANSSTAALEVFRDEILRDNKDLHKQGVVDLSNILAQSLAVMQQQLSSGLAVQVNAMQDATLSRVEQMLGNLSNSYDARLDARLRDLETGQEGIRADNAAMRMQVQQLRETLAIGERQAPMLPRIPEQDFDRMVDATILRINTPHIVLCDELTKVLLPWLDEAQTPQGSCRLVAKGPLPDAPSRRFILSFTGDTGTAARRAGKARALLRTDGRWREFGSYRTVTEGNDHRVFVSVDKNPRQLRTETDAKRLAASIREVAPPLADRLRLNRVDGLVSLDSLPLVRVRVAQDAATSLQWIATTADAAALDRAAVLTAFRDKTKRPDVESLPWE